MARIIRLTVMRIMICSWLIPFFWITVVPLAILISGHKGIIPAATDSTKALWMGTL